MKQIFIALAATLFFACTDDCEVKNVIILNKYPQNIQLQELHTDDSVKYEISSNGFKYLSFKDVAINDSVPVRIRGYFENANSDWFYFYLPFPESAKNRFQDSCLWKYRIE